MSRKRKISPQKTQAILDMYKAGKPIKAIARELHTTPITVRSYVKKAGLYNAAVAKKSAPRVSVAPNAKSKTAATARTSASVKPVASLATLISQLKATEEEIAALQRQLAGAVEKHARQFDQLKRMVNI